MWSLVCTCQTLWDLFIYISSFFLEFGDGAFMVISRSFGSLCWYYICSLLQYIMEAHTITEALCIMNITFRLRPLGHLIHTCFFSVFFLLVFLLSSILLPHTHFKILFLLSTFIPPHFFFCFIDHSLHNTMSILTLFISSST